MRTTRALLLPAALSFCLSLTLLGCGDGDDAATDDVASLGNVTDSTAGDDETGAGGPGGRSGDNVAFEDAALEFAECMREHGVDMPDPDFTGDGGVISVGPVGDGERATTADMEQMQAAQEACQPIMEEARSELPPMDPAELEEMRQNALEFSECMREHGIDFPDPVFNDDGGGVAIAIGGGGDGSTGPAFDPEDEDFQEASEECGGEGGFMVGSRGADDGEDG